MYIKEVAASLYPWDLADEGVENILDNLTNYAGVNSVYLVGIMHNEKRPLRELYYPHNPKRKFYTPEDSRVYYRMDLDNFKNTPLKPIFTEVDFLKGKDWLDELIQAARKRGMKVGSEISHTIFDSKRAMKDHYHLLQKNVKGELVKQCVGANRTKLFCPNQEQVSEYIVKLFFDTVKNHDIDFIQSCLILFAEGSVVKFNNAISDDDELEVLLGTLEGGCFCDSCREKAIALGYDFDQIRTDLSRLYDIVTQAGLQELVERKLLDQGNLTASGFLLENPSFYQWLEFRQRSITTLFQRISDEIRTANSKIEFRYNTYLKYPELAGLSFSQVKPHIDSIRESDYCEIMGEFGQLKAKREKVLKIRRGIGYEKDLIAAVDVRPNRFGESNVDVVRESVRLLADLGIDGISLGHYDEATFARLKAVKEGMEAGEIYLLGGDS